MKKLFFIVLISVFILAVIGVNANNYINAGIVDYDVNFDGRIIKFNSPTVSIDGKVYVPVREYSEAIGASVYWNEEAKSVDIYYNELPDSFVSDNWEVFSAVKDRRTLYGYKDENGETVIEPKFNKAKEFHEGVAVIGLFNRDGQLVYGTISESGDVLLTPMFSYISGYSEGLCVLQRGRDSEYYYIDHNNIKVFDGKKFLFAGDFSQGYAYVKVSGVIPSEGSKLNGTPSTYSYIDKSGELATDKEWDQAYPFNSDGTAKVELDGRWMRIDKNFEVVEYLN